VVLLQWVKIPPGQLAIHPEENRTVDFVRNPLKLRFFK
jgi:hypothetical protein